MTETVVLAVVAGLFGLTLGSFLNVCAYRWPNDLSVVSPRSRCSSCETQIRWNDMRSGSSSAASGVVTFPMRGRTSLIRHTPARRRSRAVSSISALPGPPRCGAFPSVPRPLPRPST